jgi:hypothetical protein
MPCVKLALSSIVAVVFAICLVDKSYMAEWSANCRLRSQRHANEESVDNHLRPPSRFLRSAGSCVENEGWNWSITRHNKTATPKMSAILPFLRER